jgi:geranylgeranyl diphosphate synthase, type I
MLGVWGDPSTTGKPVGNDLRLRKKTLPISIAYSKGFDVFDEGTTPLDEQLSDAAVAEAMVYLDECGARYETMELAGNELDAALTALDGASIADSARAELVVTARFVVERDL